MSPNAWIGGRTRHAVAILLSALLVLIVPLIALANVSLVQLSSDPYTNADSQHKTEVEPGGFAFGSTIVSAFQVGRFYNGGASNIGYATSTNGGVSWTSGFLPGTTVSATPAGAYGRASDPTVAYDAKHGVWLISYLGIVDPAAGPVDVLVSRSTDGGLTWGAPVVLNASGHFNDKNWTTCDNTPASPFYGNCYTEYDDNSLGDLIQMSTSTNGGLTWGAAQPTAKKGYGLGGEPVVQPNGTVVVPIMGFQGANYLMLAFTSTDGGKSWSAPNIIARIATHVPAGSIRADYPLPAAGVDGAGKVYVVWSDCHFEPGCNASDLVLTTSMDGQKWSKLTRVPLDPRGSGVDHFIPGLAVDRSTSHLALTYYYYPNANCTTATCQLNVGYSTSTDGGASWTANAQIAGPMSLTWLPNTTQGYMVGDYLAGGFSGGSAVAPVIVANAPGGGLLDEAAYVAQGGLSFGGAAIPAADQMNAATNATPSSSTAGVH